MVLDACPDIIDYAKSGEIASWREKLQNEKAPDERSARKAAR